MFSRWGPHKATIHWPSEQELEEDSKAEALALQRQSRLLSTTGTEVDLSCNTTITLTCLKQLYNTVGYVPQVPAKTSIGTTGYLEQFANLEDLKSFYLDQLPEAVNSSFTFVSVKGDYHSYFALGSEC